MRLKLISLVCILLVLCSENWAQENHAIDSLKLEIQITNSPSKKIDLLIEVSKAASELNLPEEALEFATEAFNIASEEGLKKEQILAMTELASAHNDLNEYKKAFSLANQAKELADKNNFEIESAEVSQLLAQMFFVIGEFDKSVELSFNASKVLEEYEDYSRLSTSLEMIGRNYSIMGKDSLGTEYLLKAINYARTYENYATLGVSMVNLSNSYYLKQQPHKAINLLKEGCKLLLSHKNNASAIGIGFTNIALNYLALKQLDSTLVYLNKAEIFNSKINNFRNLINTHNAYAYYYQQIDDEQKFLEHANKAFSISRDNDFRFEQRIIARLLEEFYLKDNQLDSAYKYRCIRHEIGEIIYSQNTLTKLAHLEMVKELELAEKEKILQERKRVLVNMVILVILMFSLIVLVVLLRNYRTKVKFSKLKQAKLEDEIAFKSKEMTIQLMDLTKRNELLADITKELISVSKGAQKDETKNAINRIALDIEKATEGKIWEEFILRFKEVHSSFYKNLLDKYPNLSPNEQRLCAFLKLNLSTKEILSMTGQSERSIVMARHRLRKKLGIESQEVNLTTFISKI